jgi:hypothetical protein
MKKRDRFESFLIRVKECRNRDRNNIVKSMSTGRYAKTPNRIQDCEINPRDRTKNKRRPIKRVDHIRPAAEKIDMVMRTEQRC